MVKFNLYCDTCVPKSGKSKEEDKCIWCDGYVRQIGDNSGGISKDKIVWIKKGLIWVHKK